MLPAPIQSRDRPRFLRAALTAAALSAVVLVTYLWFSQDEVRTITYTAPFGAVEVDNSAGAVLVVATDRSDVLVVELLSWLGTRPEISAEVVGGVLRLSARCGAIPWGCQVDQRLEVPRNVAVTVRSAGGGVRVTGTSAPVDVQAEGGTVSVAGATGGVTANLGQGTLELADVGGRLAATVQEGIVYGTGLRVPETDVGLRRGSVTLGYLDVIQRVNITTGNGDINVVVPGGPYRVDAQAGSGGVAVRVPVDPNSGGVITARTGAGLVTVANP